MITVGAILRKVRRAAATTLAPDYVTQAIRARRGDCDRCGHCCKIVFRCPFFDEQQGCTVYDDRPPSCRAFPIAPSDLLDVPACSYSFT